MRVSATETNGQQQWVRQTTIHKLLQKHGQLMVPGEGNAASGVL